MGIVGHPTYYPQDEAKLIYNHEVALIRKAARKCMHIYMDHLSDECRNQLVGYWSRFRKFSCYDAIVMEGWINLLVW